MADQQKKTLNPNAPVFVPNANARAFVPGQNIHPVVAAPSPQPPAAPVAAPVSTPAPTPTPPSAPTQPPVSNGEQHLKQSANAPVEAKPPVADVSSKVEGASVGPVDTWDEKEEETEEPRSQVPLQDDPELDEEESTSIAPVIKPKHRRDPTAPADARMEHVNVIFIGHVDAGKSTIGGQIMYLTGMVDKRTLEKYEREAKEKNRESWYLSWALDTNLEEREKGKTVEVGRAYFETEKKHFTILDAPGHKSFVPNMISGASQADLAVLVISARKGEFETGFDRGGQTREHAMLVKTAGVRHLCVLVNKMDDTTVNWDEERYIEIQNKLTPYLKKCGFNPKTDIHYFPCSGLTGAFLKERPEATIGSWYHGPCFIEFIDNHLPPMSRDFDGPIRVVIVDKFNDMGTIVIGKVESGAVVKGQSISLMPNRTTVQVIQLWSDEVETDDVGSGENVRMKLKGIEDTDVLPGFILCSLDSPCKVGRIFDAEVVILEHKSIICTGYSCVLHIHAAVEEVTVKVLICTIDKKTGAKVKSRFVKQDEKCIMRLESAEMFCLEAFKDFPQMGRFTLRDEGRTIAIGKVLKVVE
uniref:Tr-type G domain-containing protein n=1 Tax=Plectus sambesii TaxID=2011161 RepID=A0A914X6W8_9BILA